MATICLLHFQASGCFLGDSNAENQISVDYGICYIFSNTMNQNIHKILETKTEYEF